MNGVMQALPRSIYVRRGDRRLQLRGNRRPHCALRCHEARVSFRTMRRAFKYRLYPTKAQKIALNDLLTGARRLYNAALQQRRWMWRDHGISIGYLDQAAQLRKRVMLTKSLNS
jgi:hypothetical protein